LTVSGKCGHLFPGIPINEWPAHPENLSLKAVAAIENALENNNKLYISVITIIEIIYLVEKRKIPGKGLEMLMRNIRTPASELHVLPIDTHVAEELGSIPREKIPDMPDRIIAAVAQHFNLPLITKDGKITQAGIKVIW